MKEEVEKIFAPVIGARENTYKAFKSLIDGIIKKRDQLAKKANGILYDPHSHHISHCAFTDAAQAALEQTIKLEEAISAARRLGFNDMVQKVAGELGFDPVTLEPTKTTLQKKLSPISSFRSLKNRSHSMKRRKKS